MATHGGSMPHSPAQATKPNVKVRRARPAHHAEELPEPLHPRISAVQKLLRHEPLMPHASQPQALPVPRAADTPASQADVPQPSAKLHRTCDVPQPVAQQRPGATATWKVR